MNNVEVVCLTTDGLTLINIDYLIAVMAYCIKENVESKVKLLQCINF
jgi:hypothetical protein